MLYGRKYISYLYNLDVIISVGSIVAAVAQLVVWLYYKKATKMLE